jgi:heptosyltransferase II
MKAEPNKILPNKILVVQTAFLGDMVMTLPLLSAIKQGFPKASLSVLIVPKMKEILGGHPAVDEVLVYDKNGDQQGIFGFVRLAKILKNRGYDLCLLPHRSFRSGLLAYLSGIPLRIGFQKPVGWLFCTQSVSRDKTKHEVDRNLQLLSPLGIERTSQINPQLSATPEARYRIEETFKNAGLQQNDLIVGIAPGSVWATKRWLPEGFAAVADTLVEKLSAKVLLLGSRNEEPIAHEIIACSKKSLVNLMGQSIMELVATLSRCRLLITNDNGAMHIAAALNIPIVAIFGSTSPEAGYGPYTHAAGIVEHTLSCRPCGLHGYRRCPQGHFRCMKEITAQEVIAMAEKQLKTL